MDAALVPTQDGAKNMTTEILTAIEAAAKADAIVFEDEFPGEQPEGSDWDSAAFEMHHKLNEIEGAFDVYRKHLAAEVDRLTAARMQATLTEVNGASLKSSDLRKEARSTRNVRQCYRSSEKVGSDAIEIVFCPEINRAGVAAGSDAQWTDASSAADALRRFLYDAMVN